MVYLDYSATTPTSKEVLDSFDSASLKYIGNPNSLHKLGIEANKVIEASTKQIANILGVKENEIIYTSGASESNNLAIKGIASKYKNRGKHIITTNFEHSSIYGPLSYLQKEGFDIDIVKCDKNGLVDLKDLNKLLNDQTILVSITYVNSEIGIINQIDEIKKIIKKYPKCFFHVDMTQAVGKLKIDLNDIDLASFSAHKFFGIKGIGVLIKKDSITLDPIIHGGKSTTKYRSGTPCLPLIVSLAKALRLAYEEIDKKYKYVSELNSYLVSKLSKYKNVYINSNSYCSPYILNISITSVKPETMLHALEEGEIYISTQTACSSSSKESRAVMAFTNDINRATSSIRISLSYLTTKEEIEYFLLFFDKCYKKLCG